MGEVVPISDTAIRKTTPGQALYAAIHDTFAADGVTLPPRAVATAAKQGRDALEAGVDPNLVLEGCVAALRQGKQRFTSEIISDVVLAVAGLRMTPREYGQKLDAYKNDHDPSVTAQRSLLERARDWRQP